MSFYSGLADTASRLLSSKGQLATWEHDNGDSDFDPVTGAKIGGTVTDYSAKGVLVNFETSRVDGSSVLATDKQFFMEVGDKPEVRDIITVNGIAYQAIAVEETSPGGIPLLYEVQLRS